MSRSMMHIGIGILFAFPMLLHADASAAEARLLAEMSEETQECLNCHADDTKIIYQQWGKSKHFRANVGCYECHRAEKGDAGRRRARGLPSRSSSRRRTAPRATRRKSRVRRLPPLEGRAHHGIAGQHPRRGRRGQPRSENPRLPERHLRGGGQRLLAVPRLGGEGARGRSLDPATWPNTGMGRINPDGSEGSCSACHQRHDVLRGAGAAARELRQVPHGPGSPADRDLRGVEARDRIPRTRTR